MYRPSGEKRASEIEVIISEKKDFDSLIWGGPERSFAWLSIRAAARRSPIWGGGGEGGG